MWIPSTLVRAYGKIFATITLGFVLPGAAMAQTVSDGARDVFAGNQYSPPRLSLVGGGTKASSTPGSASSMQVGYANVTTPGSVPYGTAVFSLAQNGTVVSEVGVPASPPTTRARIFIDYRSGGSVDTNTGLAVANAGTLPANVTYTLRNLSAQVLATAHGTLDPGRHRAKFINHLDDKDVNLAPDFTLPPDFAVNTQFGSLEIFSDQPLSIVALRMTTNQRGEVLFTSTPIADLNQTPGTSAAFFPQFVDGGGNDGSYTTALLLLNTSNVAESGSLRILDEKGNSMIVKPVGGTANSTFRYEQIPPGGGYVLRTDGSSAAVQIGWVILTPDQGTSTPVGEGVFSFTQNGKLVTEAGIPSAVPMTHARVYIDTSGGHDTGLAIANPGTSPISVILTAYQCDGVTAVGSYALPSLGPNIHTAGFVDQFIKTLPAGFTGVLDINSYSSIPFITPNPFVALTLRSLVNARNDFLLTTLPVADISRPAPSPIVFPQIADGGGYTTQFIMIGATGDNSMTLSLVGDEGSPLRIPLSFTLMGGPYGIDFMTIPSGQFLMGTPDDAAHVSSTAYDYTPERPVHSVVISRFFELGEFEITQGQWKAVMGASSNPSYHQGNDSLPVETVTWNDVQGFISRLNALNDGYQYNLPAEAEWEYACRAGTTGDYSGNLDDMAWDSYNSGQQSHVVGTKSPNPWGLYDIYGNVLEWVQDWYGDKYYSSGPAIDPAGPTMSSWTQQNGTPGLPHRGDRGGSWGNHLTGSTSSSRHHTDPNSSASILGFRLMRRLIN